MTPSHDPSPFTATNSSADANPRAPYPSEWSDSTSARRKDSSSSMTAISSSLDTHHPLPGPGRRNRALQLSHAVKASRNYTRVLGDLLSPLVIPPGFEHFGHPDEIRQGSCAHFAHRRAAVDFHGDLADAEIAGHLLVHLAGCYQLHDLQFPGRERSKPLLHLRKIALDRPPLPVTGDGGHHGVEHVLVVKRLGKKAHSAALHPAN